MKIELATIQDVPALLDLQRKAFGPLCEELYATGTGESNSMSYLCGRKPRNSVFLGRRGYKEL